MTFKEIKQQAEEKQVKRYYKSNVLNQNKGLTDFIKELEQQAKEKNIYFDIVGGSPKLVIPYTEIKQGFKTIETVKHEEDKEILFTGYIAFIYDNFYYYIQIDDNPFFNHYINKIPLLKDSEGLFFIGSHYLDNIKNLYNDITTEELFSYNQTARIKIKENLFNIFNSCKISKKYEDKRWSKNYKHYINKEKKIYFNI